MLKIKKSTITVLLKASSRPCCDNFLDAFLYQVCYLRFVEMDNALLNRIAGEVKLSDL
jgi:hypothetical protein